MKCTCGHEGISEKILAGALGPISESYRAKILWQMENNYPGLGHEEGCPCWVDRGAVAETPGDDFRAAIAQATASPGLVVTLPGTPDGIHAEVVFVVPQDT